MNDNYCMAMYESPTSLTKEDLPIQDSLASAHIKY